MARDLTTEEVWQLDHYTRGVIDGIQRYAWFKDGVQYVGTTGTTLQEATAQVLRENDKHALADALMSR